MLHVPRPYDLPYTTHELVAALMNRLDTHECLHSLLALMVGMSGELSISRQYRMAGSLRDAASMIEHRPAVHDLANFLELMPTYDKEGTST
jgi:hypothetical protein